MAHINIEVKARCKDIGSALKSLQEATDSSESLVYFGSDYQVDTYFNVPNGRLKLREGDLENCLIHYFRDDKPDAKLSDVYLHRYDPPIHIKNMLTRSLGVLAVVVKHRQIYFVRNVKLHFDRVSDLGDFVEVEAIDTGGINKETLQEQCDLFTKILGIQPEDQISGSYVDLMLEKKGRTE